MVKEYCDRCKAEIDPHERLSKKIVKITIPSRRVGMNTQDQLHCARNASAKWESRKSQKVFLPEIRKRKSQRR